MPIQTSCPSCFRPLRVPDELIGQPVRCPGCATEWIAAAESSPPAASNQEETVAFQPPREEKPADAIREGMPAEERPGPVSEGIREVPSDTATVPPPPPAPPDRDEFEDEDDAGDAGDDRYFERLEGRRRERLRRDYSKDAKAKVMGPAIGLMVTAIITLLSALLSAGYGALQMVMLASMTPPSGGGGGASPRGIFAIIGGSYGLIALLFLVLGAVTLYGAIQMLRLRRHAFALTACIIGIIPCQGCCSITGLPFGIWGLVVLLDPKVKAVFGRGGRSLDQPLPPMPEAGE